MGSDKPMLVRLGELWVEIDLLVMLRAVVEHYFEHPGLADNLIRVVSFPRIGGAVGLTVTIFDALDVAIRRTGYISAITFIGLRLINAVIIFCCVSIDDRIAFVV